MRATIVHNSCRVRTEIKSGKRIANASRMPVFFYRTLSDGTVLFEEDDLYDGLILQLIPVISTVLHQYATDVLSHLAWYFGPI